MPGSVLALSALEQAAAVRSGGVSARELVAASLAAIDRLDADVNAFVTVCAERALAEAERVRPGDGRPLAGVPIGIKDLGALTAGVRTTMGSWAMEDFVPAQDSAAVRRLREAGAIVVGKTNTPELGILPVTEPARFGPSRNPWDRSRTPGGSSGGSAAAVAAGMVALGHGGDGGGSLRIPASCCGLVGLKPSRGRVSPAPGGGDVAGLAVQGVLTRTVADTAAALDVLSGYEPGDPVWAPPPAQPFSSTLRRAPPRLRVAVATAAPAGWPVEPDCVRATEAAAGMLESLGHHVDAGAPDWADRRHMEQFMTVWTALVEASATAYVGLRGQALQLERFEPLTREMIQAARRLSSLDLLRAIDDLRVHARRVLRLWSDHDLLLTPTLARVAPPIGALRRREGESATDTLWKGAAFAPFTPLWNVTGQPAISLPLHQSAGGLPVGVQLVGPPAGEEMLLWVAAQLEAAAPWADRRPAVAPAGSA